MHTDKTPHQERVHFSANEASEHMLRILARIGYNSEEQKIIAGHLLDAALCGYEYSGLPKILDLAGYAKAKMPRKPPRAVHETPVSELIDAGNTVGLLSIDAATDIAIRRAQVHGFAVVGVFNTWMSGRGAYFVERIARAGLIGIHTVASFPIVAPPGAAEAAIGTNPIAFSFPTQADPLVIDLGTSAYMFSELALVERRGGLLPEGVAIDADGHPTRDPAQARQGAFLNFAGYRGFAIGLAVQALGVMAGAGMSPSPNEDCGYLLVVMRPDLMMPLELYQQELTRTLARIKATPTLPGVDSIRIPSERAFATRNANIRNGIAIDRHIWEALQALPGKPGEAG